MLAKKSAFDVLMNKINKPKDESNTNSNTKILKESKRSSSNVLNKNDQNQNENDIIYLSNESNSTIITTSSTDCEIVSDENSSNNSKTLQNKNIKNSPRKKLTNFNYSLDPLLLQHTHQYTENDLKFIDSLNQSDLKAKLTLQEEDVKLKNVIDLKQPLLFDFTKYNQKLPECICKPDSTSDLANYPTSEKVKFNLNGSFDANQTANDTITEEKTESSMILNKTVDSLNDTLNDTTLNLSNSSSFLDSSFSGSTRGARNSKRRKTESKPKPKTIENKDSELLWTEKYQFKNEDDIVTNNSQLERLKEWLLNWKTILSKTTETISKRAYADGDESDSDYSYDSDYSNADSVSSTASIVNGRKFYSNAILLSGPYGCGKTSSIYSVAKQLGFKVFEVNASSLRCKSQIIQELEGALNSHHVSNNKGSNSTSSNQNIKNKFAKLETSKEETNNFKMEKFFKSATFSNTSQQQLPPKSKVNIKPKRIATNQKTISFDSLKTKNPKKRKNSLRREVVLSTASNRLLKEANTSVIELSSESTNEEDELLDDEEQANNNSAENDLSSTNVNIHKESLILFDEIDVVFREDVGFWAAINHFIKRSKKPIVLTTNDEFLQEKINLNIEKIDFNRPRIDASVRFLKSVAKAESARLDTPTAYKILKECKCDMRRALFQLQALLSSSSAGGSNSSLSLMKKYKLMAINSTLNFSDFLSKSFNSKCNFHNENKLFENIFFLDKLGKSILKYLYLENSSNFNQEQPASFRRFDLLLLKDGLTDNSSANVSFNPFLYQQTNETRSREDLTKLNTTFAKEELNEFYQHFILMFNDKKFIDFSDWSNYGAINEYNFASNVSINRLAQSLFRFTSNSSLCVEYRPFLQQICKIEETKQIVNTGKRRYLHYLTNLNLGLNKEDYSLLARTALFDKNEELEGNADKILVSTISSSIYDSSIFSCE